MANSSDTKAGRRRWFLWLPRALFLVAALIPISYTLIYYIFIKELGPRYWSAGLTIPSTILAFITLIAWVAPIISGILAIIAVLIGWVFVYLMLITDMSGGTASMLPYVVLESVLLISGGVLSIIWGIRRERERREKHEQM